LTPELNGLLFFIPKDLKSEAKEKPESFRPSGFLFT